MKFQKKPNILNFFALIVFFGCFACTKPSETGTGSEKSTSKRQVNVAIWSNYLSKNILEDFEKSTGIKVNISNYTSNEELLGKLQAGAALYDLAVPSDYMVSVMIQMKLIQALDKAKLPELQNIDPFIRGKDYDKNGDFSIPYGWGTTGIAYRKDLLKTSPPKGWKDFFDRPEFKLKMSFLDDPREVIAATLKYFGQSVNSTDPVILEKVKKKLLATKPRIKAFESDTFNSLVSGETLLAHSYSIDARVASRSAEGQVEYVYPEEGGVIWIDCLVIPKGSPHKEEVYELIRYLLTAKANVERTKNFFTTPALIGARELLPDNLKNDSVIFPNPEQLKKFELLKDLGEKNRLFDNIWTEVKSANDQAALEEGLAP